MGGLGSGEEHNKDELGTSWARARIGHGRSGHDQIVFERHGYPLVIIVVQIGAVKIYVAAVEARAQGKGKTG
jgi:hypothetical protein